MHKGALGPALPAGISCSLGFRSPDFRSLGFRCLDFRYHRCRCRPHRRNADESKGMRLA